MAHVIVKRKELQSILQGGTINTRYVEYKDIAFLPVPLAIDVIEKEKKGGALLPSNLKKLTDQLPECISTIPLNSQGLIYAINDEDFAAKYVNRTGNPIEFAAEACIYAGDGWWEKDELLESFRELLWP